jgi:hypothetical protein
MDPLHRRSRNAPFRPHPSESTAKGQGISTSRQERAAFLDMDRGNNTLRCRWFVACRGRLCRETGIASGRSAGDLVKVLRERLIQRPEDYEKPSSAAAIIAMRADHSPAGVRREHSTATATTAVSSMSFTVFVADNFHYMDESKTYKLGEFESLEPALEASKRIVDEYLSSAYQADMTAAQLYQSYVNFGEDPYIIPSEAEGGRFSAWTYARERCDAICAQRS